MTITLQTGPAAVASRRLAVALEGVRDITPMVIGVVPFALAIGAAVGDSGLSTSQGIAGAAGILAGAAQLTTFEMLGAGVAPFVIVLSALVINARILLYSASIAPWFADRPLRQRLLLALPVIDQLHFTCMPRFERGDLDRTGRAAYYVGAASWLVGAWIATQSVAIVAGARLPDELGLGIAAPLALAGLLARSVTDRPSGVAAGLAATLAVAGASLPYHSTTLVAAVAGLTAGSLAARQQGVRAPEVAA